MARTGTERANARFELVAPGQAQCIGTHRLYFTEMYCFGAV